MATIIGVRFKNAGKLYYFDPGELWPVPGNFVIVETARGMEYGQVITGVREVSEDLITPPLKTILRIANERDARHSEENERFEKEAYQICQRKIEEHKLDMKLVGVEQTFDNAKLLFYFTANGRVDFRSLVKDLASVFRTRIELRQIGVRDEAKMLGGLGPCGRPICCGSFLGDFQPVSIKMAKEQNLSLNPTKISGVCGRLMCCLKYEEDNYEQTRKNMPKIGKDVETPDGFGTVIDLNVLKETVLVRVRKGDSSELKTYPVADIRWFRPPVAATPKPAPDAAR
ncbi:MAG TPA: stage 0 sporulation family protein, partial [Candidatus Limiplasma sp.]|nr:stage 0 sporulation family protein [Candidatus Limiplasma sp.]